MLFRCVLLFLFSGTCLAQTKLDLLQDSLSRVRQDPKANYAVGGVLSDMGMYYFERQQFDSARQYFFRALNWNRFHAYDTLVALNLNDLGLVHNQVGFPDSAIWYHRKALAIQQTLGDELRAAHTLVNMGIYYKDLGLYDESLQASFDAALKLEKYPPGRNLASCYNTIGIVYGRIRQYDQAVNYLRMALEIRQKINYTRGIAQSYNNIGNIFVTRSQYDSALYYFNQSLAIKRSQKDTNGTATTLHNIGDVYRSLKRYAEARDHYQQSLTIKEAIDDQAGMALSLTGLGQVAYEEQDWRNAHSYLKRAEEMALNVEALEILRDNYATQEKLYDALHEPQRALDYSRKLLAVSDSIFSVKKREELSEKNISFRIRQQMAGLEQTLALQVSELENKKIWIGSLIMILILLSVIGALITHQLRTARKGREKIEVLLRELHHRVKNNLQMLSSVFTLQAHMVTDAGTREAIRSSEGRVNAMALIHKKLYRETNNHTIELQEYITDLVEFIKHSFQMTQVPVITIEIPRCYIDVDRAISIGLLLNELVSNAFKHAFTDVPDPRLRISIANDHRTLHIQVSDNGAGFKMDASSPDSFGLKLVHILIRDLRGTLKMATDRGTKFDITLPDF